MWRWEIIFFDSDNNEIDTKHSQNKFLTLSAVYLNLKKRIRSDMLRNCKILVKIIWEQEE